MAILVSCLCGKRLKAPERLAGKRAKCPECGKVLEVPDTESEDSAGAYGLAPEEDRDCPECGRKVDAAARRCHNCGLDLHTGRRVNEAAACSVCGGPLSQMGRCPQCAQAQVALAAARDPKELRVECDICGQLIYEDQECPSCARAEESVDAALRKKKKKAKGTSTGHPTRGSSKVEDVLERLRRRIQK